MRLHRFYIDSQAIELKHDFWLHDEAILRQWNKVLRFRADQQVVLFDGVTQDRLYKIVELTSGEAHLQLVTEMERQTPKKEIYLFWSLLKKDKNDWVLQKCTELGVSHFVPILAERSEKTGFNSDRARKIIIEATEQCGRSDIPAVREPMNLESAIKEYSDKATLFVADKSDNTEGNAVSSNPVGVFVGPEGGWTEAEKQFCGQNGVRILNIHDFTLRAETACVTAVAGLIQ